MITILNYTNKVFETTEKAGKLKFTFEAKNAYSIPVVLGATASCGCTDLKIILKEGSVTKTPNDTIELEPNETFKVEVVFNPDGRVGENTKRVYLHAHHAPHEETAFKFKVNVKK